ncbi:MAG: hypothetical protein AAFN11_00325 [Chloroflexota bacterium]
MSSARERRKRRQERQAMATKQGRSNRQVAEEARFKAPSIEIPGARWLVAIPAAGLMLLGVILALRFINPPDEVAPPNAIWLNSAWTYAERSTEDLAQLTIDLTDNDVGTIFLYVSSLRSDNTWSGRESGNNQFTEVEPTIETLLTQLRATYPNVRVYAWVEVNARAPQYRMDDLQVQNTIANFSQRMISQLEFDGVLLDVKPIFEENEDYISLLRTVRREIGIDTQLLVAVPADLTPSGTTLNLPPFIAPGTEWSAEYKQRVALLANQIVILAYNSYQTDPVDYIQWVTYQVESYIEVLSAIESNTTILVSVPNYDDGSDAHDPDIESLAASLDGVARARTALDETTTPLLTGVAIYTDNLLSNEEWRVYTERWLR